MKRKYMQLVPEEGLDEETALKVYEFAQMHGYDLEEEMSYLYGKYIEWQNLTAHMSDSQDEFNKLEKTQIKELSVQDRKLLKPLLQVLSASLLDKNLLPESLKDKPGMYRKMFEDAVKEGADLYAVKYSLIILQKTIKNLDKNFENNKNYNDALKAQNVVMKMNSPYDKLFEKQEKVVRVKERLTKATDEKTILDLKNKLTQYQFEVDKLFVDYDPAMLILVAGSRQQWIMFEQDELDNKAYSHEAKIQDRAAKQIEIKARSFELENDFEYEN